MIKDNAHIELEIFIKKFLEFNPLSNKIRILNWNFILRNLAPLKSDTFIYLFIDPIENLLNNENKKLKNYAQNFLEKYNLNRQNVYRIKFLSEHKNPFKWYSRTITKENFQGRFGIGNSIEKEIHNIADYLKYKFNVYDLNIKTKDDEAYEIYFFIKENYISFEI